MLGKVGPDHEASGVLDQLTQTDFSANPIGISSDPTGTTHVFVGPEGDNWIIVQPGANNTIDSAYSLNSR